MKYSLFILIILSTTIVSFGIDLNVVHKWNYCDYEWENQQQKEDAINSGSYKPRLCVFFDVAKANDGRVFITTPKYFGPVVPVTLTTVTNKTGPGGPLLRPYPNWSWHNYSRMCDSIINVNRVHIHCNHIFVLDSGTIGLKQICNPKLLIFDLKDDTLVKTIYIPLDIATDETGTGMFVAPFVYNPRGCTRFLDNMILFMADSKGSGIVVYDSSRKHMCRVESDYMKPIDTSFSIAGESFTFPSSILGMTIVDKELYYVVVTGKEIYKIKIERLLKCPNKEEANKHIELVTKLSSRSAYITSAGDLIFYGNYIGMTILGKNVSKKSVNKNTVVIAQDDESLQGVSSLKTSYYWNELTGLSSRFYRFAAGTVRLNETNARYFETNLTGVLKIMDSIPSETVKFKFPFNNYTIYM